MKSAMQVMLALAIAGTAQAQPVTEIASGASERETTAITVYNDDLALVKERRKVILPSGVVQLSWREVSAQMRPETALMRAITGDPIRLLEQNFDYDLLTPQKLLEKYVGQEVTVVRTHPTSGEERREKATVLANNNGTVLRFADRIETGVPGRIVFNSVPSKLRDRPTLSMLLTAAGGSRSLELSYLTGGLAWRADYVANLSADGTRMDLSGWVTLSNHSGVAYNDAKLQLVAGTVNRVSAPQTARPYAIAALASGAKTNAAQEALLDYHLYTFERPTSIADQQTKQLALLSADAIAVRRTYLLTGADYYYRERVGQIAQKLKPAVFIEFDNQGGQLGQPLPAGVVRVYGKDSQGAGQFVGEDRIGHTAKNETVKLKLGEAFDITAERKQTAYKKLGDTTTETSYRIDLRNAKDEKIVVRIQEPLPGDWEILHESHKSSRESSRLVSWQVEVPAGGSAALDYTVRVRW